MSTTIYDKDGNELPCHTKADVGRWDEAFEFMERNHGWLPEHKERIKSFITSELARQRNEIVERVEGMIENKRPEGGKKKGAHEDRARRARNQSLRKVLSALKKEVV